MYLIYCTIVYHIILKALLHSQLEQQSLIVFVVSVASSQAHLTDCLSLFLGIDVDWSLIDTSKRVILWIMAMRKKLYIGDFKIVFIIHSNI